MSIAFFNGAFMPLADIHISPLDRGFLFADGVYEVIPVYHGQPFRLLQHLRRLAQSLAAIRLTVDDAQLPLGGWEGLINQLISYHGGGHLVIYLQVTRGAPALRDHGFAPVPTPPTRFAMVNPLKPVPEALHQTGIRVITVPDERGTTCHIKSLALLANVLARQQALDQGMNDALLVRDGHIIEGPASNVMWVRDGVLHTPPKDHHILGGITRDLVLELAAQEGLPSIEDTLPVEALFTVDELWMTSSTKEILPVTQVDGRLIGQGVPGPLWRHMMAWYGAYKTRVCPPSR